MEGLGLQYLPFALSDFRKRSAFSILEAKPADDEVTGAASKLPRRREGDMTIQMHSRLEHSLVNGPGSRAVIWLQGCSLNCPGCWNPLSHSFDSGLAVEVASVLEWVANLKSNHLIDGLTISGGEPLEQADALLALLQTLRLRVPEISIGVFSGYTSSELARGAFLSRDGHLPSHQADLWRTVRLHLDFAVLGRFNGHRLSNQPLVSSQNQELLLLSDRHSSNEFSPLSVEFTIDSLGTTQITGFPILQ